MMKKLILVICSILLLGGCTSPVIEGSTLLKTVVVSGMFGTAGAITFDKEIYEALKDEDWFMIDPEQYMPKSISLSEK